MQYVLVDTGVWYAMCDPADEHHREVKRKSEVLNALRVVLPWPTMYETLRTKLVRSPIPLGSFERFLKRPNIEYIDDAPFRFGAMELAFESSLRRKRPLSMVDCLIRLLIEDKKTKIGYLATFNNRDFVDVCRKHRVQMV
jgi:predicted nucleic acid-binding protein